MMEKRAQHKRVLSSGEASSAKRPNPQFTEQSVSVQPTIIYIVIETAARLRPTVIGACSTLADAHRVHVDVVKSLLLVACMFKAMLLETP